MVILNFSSLTTCMWSVSKFFQFYLQINPSLPPPSLVQVSTMSHLNQHNRLLGGLFHSSLPQSIFNTVEAQVRPWRSCIQNAPVVLIPEEQQIPYKHLQNLAWFGLLFPLSLRFCMPPWLQPLRPHRCASNTPGIFSYVRTLHVFFALPGNPSNAHTTYSLTASGLYSHVTFLEIPSLPKLSKISTHPPPFLRTYHYQT